MCIEAGLSPDLCIKKFFVLKDLKLMNFSPRETQGH